MNRLLILLTVCVMAMFSLNVCAQETPNNIDDLEARLSLIKNPFKSQLPQTEQDDDDQETPEIKKPPNPPVDSTPNEVVPTDIKPTDSIPETSDLSEPEEVKEIIPLPDVKISGIIWNSDRPQAIINGSIVDIGDSILGIQITEIRKTGIDGLFHGRSVTIQTQRSKL